MTSAARAARSSSHRSVLTGPGGDGHLSVVTPVSPIGKAVIGKKTGDVIDVTVDGELREWQITYVE
jgi:transcription elongation GreA/GreB family factor